MTRCVAARSTCHYQSQLNHWIWASVVGPVDVPVSPTTDENLRPQPSAIVTEYMGANIEPTFAGNPYAQVEPGSSLTIKAFMCHGIQVDKIRSSLHLGEKNFRHFGLTRQEASKSAAPRNTGAFSDHKTSLENTVCMYLAAHTSMIFDSLSEAQQTEAHQCEFSFGILDHDHDQKHHTRIPPPKCVSVSVSDRDIPFHPDRSTRKSYLRVWHWCW